jgi:hypothetical protein
MGGSGGGLSSSSLRKVREDLQKEQEHSEDQAFDTRVSEMLDDRLAEYNRRNTEAIQRHLEDVRSAITDSIEGTVETLFGGSVGKHTYVNGLSDIDALVLLRDQELAAKSPAEVLRDFGRILRQTIRGATVTRGTLAVTLRFADGHELQLLPAIRTQAGFRIASSDGRHWSEIRPERFARKLTEVNRACGGNVIPTIKLAKPINEGLAAALRLTGYHLESLAVEAFKSYQGRQTTKAMLQHFFTAAAELVKQPITDRTGQSVHVDDYLGPADSARRRAVSQELGRIARAMRNADRTRSAPQWNALLGDTG